MMHSPVKVECILLKLEFAARLFAAAKEREHQTTEAEESVGGRFGNNFEPDVVNDGTSGSRACWCRSVNAQIAEGADGRGARLGEDRVPSTIIVNIDSRRNAEGGESGFEVGGAGVNVTKFHPILPRQVLADIDGAGSETHSNGTERSARIRARLNIVKEPVESHFKEWIRACPESDCCDRAR